MNFLNTRIRISIVLLAVFIVVCAGFYFFIDNKARAADDCASLGLSILPSYIKLDDLEPGTARVKKIRIKQSCLSAEYAVGVEVEGDIIAPWLRVEPGHKLRFSADSAEEYVNLLVSAPFNAKAGIYRGALLFKLLPYYAPRSGVTINTSIAVRAIIKLTVIDSGRDILTGSEPIITGNERMFDRLRGRILINVDKAGRAYYIDPRRPVMHYLGRPEAAFALMREQGEGITNIDLEKIPEGVMGGDNDLIIDLTPVEIFAKHNAGRIFLQTEKNGEAWYINPADYKRYYLGRPEDAFALMRELGLGISGEDFNLLILGAE